MLIALWNLTVVCLGLLVGGAGAGVAEPGRVLGAGGGRVGGTAGQRAGGHRRRCNKQTP